MKKLIYGFMAVAALAGAVSLSAQTADEIVGKYVAAIGGKDAISQVKSMIHGDLGPGDGDRHPGHNDDCRWGWIQERDRLQRRRRSFSA